MNTYKLVAALVLSPLMLHAEDRTASTTKVSSVRISTGVVAPKLLETVPVRQDAILSSLRGNTDAKVVLSMTVDATGAPSDLKVVESAGAIMDKNVLDAVSHYRYQPGTVSGQAVAFPVRLEVTLQHAGM